jgi:hypothetical protein
MALSTRGRGAHVAPSGVTTSFHQPRSTNVSGMWTVIVSPSTKTVALRPSCCPPPRAPPGGTVRPQTHVRAVQPHVHPLDEQLHDPRVLGGEQLVPQRVELARVVRRSRQRLAQNEP